MKSLTLLIYVLSCHILLILSSIWCKIARTLFINVRKCSAFRKQAPFYFKRDKDPARKSCKITNILLQEFHAFVSSISKRGGGERCPLCASVPPTQVERYTMYHVPYTMSVCITGFFNVIIFFLLLIFVEAAVVLNNIEEKIGANETRNFAKILKYKLPDLSIQKNETYQKILAINNVITKMDGARLIALNKANTSYNAKANIENSMSKVAGNVLDELKSTEKELNDDAEMEIEDEIEADRKIRDAKTRNYKAAVKTAQALEMIEGYLKQLENDENRLRALDN